VLSTESKLKALYHLCYPATSLTVGNVNFNSILRDRLDISDSQIIDIIEKLLEELDEAEDCIKEAKKCLKVEAVDNIRMNKDHIKNSKDEYRRLLNKLACTVDIPARGCNTVVGVSA